MIKTCMVNENGNTENVVEMFELCPTNRKSFYGKAKVFVTDQGNMYLKSYDTFVMRKDCNGDFTRLWNGYSATTQRHIKAFSGLDKKSVDKLKCVAF